MGEKSSTCMGMTVRREWSEQIQYPCVYICVYIHTYIYICIYIYMGTVFGSVDGDRVWADCISGYVCAHKHVGMTFWGKCPHL